MITITEFQKIGVGITGFGIFFVLFGILLYFDSVLLAFGNILFLAGLAIIIGLRRTFTFFFQRPKLKGTSFFLGGILVVLFRWPVIGMILETYGFVTLFNFSNIMLKMDLQYENTERTELPSANMDIIFNFLWTLPDKHRIYDHTRQKHL
ncbi:vesicle transport protein GOT1A isoform X1 [Protopterus annectens]|uniref:vesicle transport protein GOT1A isoform X1 n=1 Tax=Protopterus annectens TaxID=7888 RepID=UPI001CFB4439|nr:vesicle transport protein GOT1A isoform X1 [Protopterus annectens]